MRNNESTQSMRVRNANRNSSDDRNGTPPLPCNTLSLQQMNSLHTRTKLLTTRNVFVTNAATVQRLVLQEHSSLRPHPHHDRQKRL